MAVLAELYLDGCSVLDVTYGQGSWWKRYLPDRFTYHDLQLDGIDFRALPYPAASFDVVTYDPPYVATGPATDNADAHDTRAAYGIEQGRSIRQLDELMHAGLLEAMRVARLRVLVKCMDYTAGGGLVLGHCKVIAWAQEAGWQVHDLLVHHTQVGQGGWNIKVQRRARRAHSYLLVLQP